MSQSRRDIYALVGLCLAVILAIPPTSEAGCTKLFSTLSINGFQYHYGLALNEPPQVVSGTIPLNVLFRTVYEGKVFPTGVSLRYTVDDVPVGPVLTNNFAYSLDTTTIPEGTHVLSVLYVNEPPPTTTCYSFFGREYSFVVENTGIPKTGSQMVPLTAAWPAIIGPQPVWKTDFINFPGFQPHAASHPYKYQFIPPAGGVPLKDLYSEPLTTQLSAEGESSPAYYRLKNGSIVSEQFYQERSNFDQVIFNWIERQGGYDGLEQDNSISPYATFVPYLDGPGFLGISIDGRLFKLNMDGSVQTLVGYVTNRNAIPYYYLDGSIPMSQVRQQQQTLLGTFDTYFQDPLDLAIDPNNHNHIYVADSVNNRIALVDLSQTTPVVSTFAGVTGKAGYLNGPKNQALFNGPSSLVIAPDETMYVVDGGNNVIRKIDPAGNVSLLVGIGYPGSATPEPSASVVANSPLTYAPKSAVPFSSAYINYPLPIRFDSKGNLVIAETVTMTVRYIDLAAQTVTTLSQLQAPRGNLNGPWLWLDVDSKGNIGTKDDILVAESIGNAGSDSVFRVPIGGTSQVPPPEVTPNNGYPLHNGHTCCAADPWTEYPWAVAIDDQEGRAIIMGYGSFGVVSLHVLQSTDPAFQINLNDYTLGKQVWTTGTVPGFPFGSRPAFSTLHGYEGHSMLGNVLNFSDMVSMTDAQLGTYLQNGAEGTVPRPEITGNDLRNLVYYIRRTATGGDLVTPTADNPDKTKPVISGVSVVQNDATDMTVNWTTDKQTLGVISWGTTSGTHFGWSPIESTYGNSHSVTVSNLPAGQTIYFVVRSKDVPGNQTVTVEQSFTLK